MNLIAQFAYDPGNKRLIRGRGNTEIEGTPCSASIVFQWKEPKDRNSIEPKNRIVGDLHVSFEPDQQLSIGRFRIKVKRLHGP